MTFKFSRSKSFLSVDAGQSLDELLQTTRRRNSKFVVVNLNRGSDDPTFYLAEHRHFLDALEQLKKQLENLSATSKTKGDVTLRDLFKNQVHETEEAETTADPLTRLSERTLSAIEGGNVVVHFRNDKPTSILIPSTIAFNKLSSRGWLDLSRLTSLHRIEISDFGLDSGTGGAGGGQADGVPIEPLEETGVEEQHQESPERRQQQEELPVGAVPPPAAALPPVSPESPPDPPAQPTKVNGGAASPPQDGGTGGNGGGSGGGTGGGPSGDPPAYPDIKVSDEHPVQSTSIDVEVRIKFEKPSQTIGTINLPSDDKQYILDVHLLLDKESRWAKLVFQRPTGTIEPAIFKGLQVPSLPEADQYGDKRVPRDIYVNFYLGGQHNGADASEIRDARWCGEAVRRIEVLPRPGIPHTPIKPPETLEWRKYLHVSPTVPPPDLLVRIKRLGEKEFQWTVLSPHQDFTGLPAEELYSTLSAAPYTFMQDHFEKFAGKQLDEPMIQQLNQACELIYAATPPGFRKAYWDLRLGTGQTAGKKGSLETIQFISDEAYIPWELMRVADDNRAPDEQPEILALRHAVGRWIAPDSLELRQSLPVTAIAVFATDYKLVPKVKTKLTWALKERDNLVKNFKAVTYDVLDKVVDEFLLRGKAQVIHFSCHGRMNVQLPEQAVIELEDADLFAAKVWSTETRRGIGLQRPLVFLNACQTGTAGELLGFVFGWPQAFLRMGATACIAPLWSVIDESAKDVAADFYDLVLTSGDKKRTTLGEALRTIRSRWKEKKSLTYLGYVLYGDPTATLDWH
jgi:hypothetical protein